ncbi:hypothetical protein Tco_0086592 [Tanacetum coccineum]
MITTSSKIEGRKPLGLMETVDIMDLIPCVGSVHCITQDLALSGFKCKTLKPVVLIPKNVLLNIRVVALTVEYWADYNDELVLLGVEDRRVVPDWILRLANDRDGWDKYLWDSYVWPTLYYQLRDANVRRWPSLYATEPTNEVDKKTYSIFGFTWAFKTWILEVFRAGPNEYYTRHRRYPRVVAWSSNKKFYRHMLRDFLHGRVPTERLIPDEIEAGSGWWVSSRAYFDGREQRSGLDQMMKQGQNIFEKINKFMEDMSVGTGANKEPIIVDQHYGISDLSGFQSMQGGPSSFETPANNPFFNMDAIVYANSKLATPIPSHPGDAGFCDPNKLDRARREQRPSVYMQSPYTHLPYTTVLPKKRVDKTKKKCKNDNVSPLNLGNAFAYDNVGGDDVVITGVHDTGIYFTYENVDPNKEDRGRQLAIMNLGHQFDNAITAKDELRKAYEEYRDIPLVQRALIENFLKIESELDQQMQNALFRKAAKLEK